MGDTFPEFFDIAKWLEARESRQRQLLVEAILHLGPELEGRCGVVYGDPAPVLRPGLDEWDEGRRVSSRAQYSLPALQGGLRIEHEPSGIMFCLIPGGTSELGLSDFELGYFESSEFLDTDVGLKAWSNGDIHTLHRLRAAWWASRLGPTSTQAFAPFLMAESPLTGGQLERLGLSPKPRPRNFSGFDCITTLEPDEVVQLLPRGMRLPTSSEWEHACRAGTRTPFHWGTELPVALPEALHPLGLSALGHFREATSTAWPEGPAEELGTIRGGAVQAFPWVPGEASWAHQLAAHRAPWNKHQAGPKRAAQAERQVALRPVIPLPFGVPAVRELPARKLQTRPSRQTNTWAGELLSMDGAVRLRAINSLAHHLSGPGVWSAQATAILPHLVALCLEEWLPDRHLIVGLIAELISAGHGAIRAIGLDRTDPRIEMVLKQPQTRLLRSLVVEHLPRLSHFAMDADPRLRAAWVMLLSLAPEFEPSTRERVDAMFEAAPEGALVASLLLALGRLDGWRRKPDQARYLAYYEHDDSLVRGAARLGHLGADPKALGDSALSETDMAALVRFVTEGNEDTGHFPWFGGDLGLLCATWISEHRRDGAPIAGLLLSRIVKAPEVAQHPRLESWAELAISKGLCGAERRGIEDFTESQWEIVSNLGRRDFPRAAPLWKEAGLSDKLGERRSILLSHGRRF